MTVISALDQVAPYTALRGDPRVLVVRAQAFPKAFWLSLPSPWGFPLALRPPPRHLFYPCVQGHLSSPSPPPPAFFLAHMHCVLFRLPNPPRARVWGHRVLLPAALA